MAISDGDKFLYSRRAFGKLALAGLPMTLALRDLERLCGDRFEDQRRPDRRHHLQLPLHSER